MANCDGGEEGNVVGDEGVAKSGGDIGEDVGVRSCNNVND